MGPLPRRSSVLALASGGRFELGIGAGDWPASFTAWGQPFPDAQSRIARLEETVRALREIWTGKQVTFQGEHVRLTKAASTPA
ncbi:MAG: LLM class flavin-dependent oxidoreductase, partial [Candidatus Limnocylindrales bacterium]